jgi:hypothetical protein
VITIKIRRFFLKAMFAKTNSILNKKRQFFGSVVPNLTSENKKARPFQRLTKIFFTVRNCLAFCSF